MNLKYLRQCIDELRMCKDVANRTTRSKEQMYLEKCREFVEILIDSNILYEFAEEVIVDSNSSHMSIDEPTTSNTQQSDMEIQNVDASILNQYQVDCNNYYTSVLNQYQSNSEEYYSAILNKYHIDCNEYYTNVMNQYHVDSEEYYTNVMNQYHVDSEEYYSAILNKYHVDSEEYYTEYNKNIADYCVWYEKELNEYYTEYLRTLCWEYYTNVEKNQVKLNKELVIKNRDVLAHNKTLQEFETKYNSLFIQNKNTTLLLNSMKSEYKDIYRRLLIMISQYNKLYIEFETYKKNIQNANNTDDIDEPNEKMNNIPDDYDYIDTEQYDNSSKE